jgi:hypothetical protein
VDQAVEQVTRLDQYGQAEPVTLLALALLKETTAERVSVLLLMAVQVEAAEQVESVQVAPRQMAEPVVAVRLILIAQVQP